MMKLADSQYDTFQIPVHQIWVDPDFNCRSSITRQSIEELSQAIEKDGLIFPIDLRPADEVEGCPPGFLYTLVCGFRRFQSVKLLNWSSVPARVRLGLTERQAQLMNLTENLERLDLNLLEEAKAIEKLFPVYRTVSSIAKELKRPENWVRVRRSLMLLSDFVKGAAASGRITARDLQTIAYHTDPDLKTRELLAAPRGKKSVMLGKQRPKKSEVKALIATLLAEGFNPRFLRVFSWVIGEISTEEFQSTLTWIRDRKGWLK